MQNQSLHWVAFIFLAPAPWPISELAPACAMIPPIICISLPMDFGPDRSIYFYRLLTPLEMM
jgi:hypothetical protein